MKNLKFWHRTINHQTFLFSTKESEEEYYQLSYELAKKLLIGMAKRSRVFCSKNTISLIIRLHTEKDS